MSAPIHVPKKVLVTGANGFLGQYVIRSLKQHGYKPIAVVRSERGRQSLEAPVRVIGDLADAGCEPDLKLALKECYAVIHLAARVHQMRDTSPDPLAEYRKANVQATQRLLEAASGESVKRFIYISSIKASTQAQSHEVDPYGQSKYEAEQAIRKFCQGKAMDFTIIRPPLVYGAGVKANFLQMMKWVDKGVPLPLGSIQNARSLVYAGNLADAIVACVDHPQASNQDFMVSDGAPLSTPQMLRSLSRAFGKKSRLVPVPSVFLKWASRLVGKGPMIDRLLGSLVVDDSLIRQKMGWKAPASFEQGLADTVNWYRGRS